MTTIPVISETGKPINFSIVIPLYNKEISVRATIQSVLNQTYPHFELIVVNDGSTDQSPGVVNSFSDDRIRMINKPNGGVSSARNAGIDNSRFDYITFLDADDLWFPNCLQEFHDLISNFPGEHVFVTNYNMTGKNLKGSSARYIVNDYYKTSAIFMAKWNIPLMLTGCVTIRKDCLNQTGVFDESITHGEDLDFWSRLSDRFTIVKSEVVTMLYRMEAENRASDVAENNKKQHIEKEIIKREIKVRSHQLYYGCHFLNLCINNLRSRKPIKDTLLLIRYWDWIIRAGLLYFRYRTLNLLK